MTGTLGDRVGYSQARLQDFDNPKNQKYDDELLAIVNWFNQTHFRGKF
jgi:hypothetical protein